MFTLDHNILFIVNDRVDLALTLDADGVHLGQDDFTLDRTRSLLGENKLSVKLFVLPARPFMHKKKERITWVQEQFSQPIPKETRK